MKRKEKLIGAILASGLFASVAVGSTLALYSTQKTVNNHLVSGGMEAELYLLELKNDVLNNDGTLSLDQPVDLTGYNGYTADTISYVNHDTSAQSSHVGGVDLETYADEIFAVERIVPTMKGSGLFLIKNAADTETDDSVAFTFGVEITKDSETSGEDLIDQVNIQINNASWDANSILKSGEGLVFSIEWQFKDLDENNDAMNQTINFDIKLTCTQVHRS